MKNQYLSTKNLVFIVLAMSIIIIIKSEFILKNYKSIMKSNTEYKAEYKDPSAVNNNILKKEYVRKK